jgi:GH25 family lysozyme M1 (1,4-beta-N-acetylmuramidase)
MAPLILNGQRLTAPTLDSPANGATGVSTVTPFSWSQVSGNQGYRIIVFTVASDLPTDPTQPGSTPSDGFNQTVSQGTTSYTWTGTLTAGATYYWEVHALGTSLAQAGYWSSQYSFTTQPIVTRLPAPTLDSPASGATGVSTTTPFSWSQVSGNQGYRIIVSTVASDLPTDPTQPGSTPSDGFNQTVSQGTTSYTWTGTLTAGATYYWEVHALGTSLAQAGYWSSQYSFTTQPIVTRLPAPTLDSPANGATEVSTTTPFSWSQESGNQGYRIVVSTVASDLPTDPTLPGSTPSDGFNQTVSQDTTSYTWTGTLTAGATYYWEVHALGTSLAQAGYWSSQYSFTTQPIVTRLLAPTLASPANGASGVSTTTPFSWSQVSGNQGYRIVVSTVASDLPTDPTLPGSTPSDGFNQTVSQDTTSYTWTGTLTAGATYYWEVHALGTSLAQAGYWSSQYSFTTGSTSTQVLGIDVSHGSISWSGMASASIQFAYLKATESSSAYTATYGFPENVSGAISQHIAVGAYHFATPLFSPEFYQSSYDHQDTAEDEAQHFVDVAQAQGSIGLGFLPPALDLEPQVVTWEADNLTPAVWVDPLSGVSCSGSTWDPINHPLPSQPAMGASALAQWIEAWVSEEEQITQVTPIVYCDRTYATALSQYLDGTVGLWIADWSDPAGSPASPTAWPWLFHQYSSTGSIAGTSPLDLDVFDGDSTAFNTLLSGASGDTTPPTIAITSPTSGSTYSTSSSTVDLGGIASDNVGVANVTWSNPQTGGTGTATGTTSWTANSITLADGANVITVTAYDAAGNNSAATLTVTYTPTDTTPPTIAITSPTSSSTYSTSSSTVSLGGNASDNVAVATVTWSNPQTGGNGTAGGTTSWTANNITLASGANVITVTAYDAAGNHSAATVTVTYTPTDTTPPTIAITSNVRIFWSAPLSRRVGVNSATRLAGQSPSLGSTSLR